MNSLDDLTELRRVRDIAASGYARTIRLGAELSLRDVARVVDVDPSTIWRWERGDRRPHGAAALRYGELLARLTSGGAA